MNARGKFRKFLEGSRGETLRRLYRRCMIGAGSAALVLSLASGCLTLGTGGLRGLAEEIAFRLPGGGEDPSAGDAASDDSLSLFLSPSGALLGDFPIGGLLDISPNDPPSDPDGSALQEDGGTDDPGGGQSSEENDPPADDAADDAAVPPDGEGWQRITEKNLSPKTARSLVNMTSSLDPDLEKVYSAYQTKTAGKPVPALSEKEPLVLILHTHSTESYAPEGASALPPGSEPRSLSHEESVIAVGTALADALEARGIPTVHCTFGHDLEDYSGAYDREKATILSYLQEYPSIRYIFDLHRDSLEQPGGEVIKTAATVNGESTAQIMFVVGTNEKGANHPGWQDNLGYALTLQTMLSERYPGLMRAVNLRGASFNEQYTPYSLLIEIGASGNTLAEAKRAAVLLGAAVADEILGEE